jgi:hypothetical protein
MALTPLALTASAVAASALASGAGLLALLALLRLGAFALRARLLALGLLRLGAFSTSHQVKTLDSSGGELHDAFCVFHVFCFVCVFHLMVYQP